MSVKGIYVLYGDVAASAAPPFIVCFVHICDILFPCFSNLFVLVTVISLDILMVLVET